MSETRNPTLQEILFRAISRAQRGIRQALPARVESYDAAARKVTVQPLLLESYEASDGTRTAEALPMITNVPVVFPGSGGARMVFPVSRGDTVLLLFSSASLDRWLVRGGQLDPGDDRNHDLNDCVALLGLQSFAEVSDADPMIEFTSGGQIHVGGSDALATKADIDALRSHIASHVHTGVTTGGGSSGPPLTPPPSAIGTLITKGS